MPQRLIPINGPAPPESEVCSRKAALALAAFVSPALHFSTVDFDRTKEKRDLDRGCVRGIRTVHRVFLHVYAEVLANRTG